MATVIKEFCDGCGADVTSKPRTEMDHHEYHWRGPKVNGLTFDHHSWVLCPECVKPIAQAIRDQARPVTD